MKKFIDHKIPAIERIDSSTGRLYKTPEGNFYPSVTGIVGSYLDNSWLNEWIEKVGKETTDAITKEAADRGTFLHLCCEKYLKEEKITFHFLQHLEKEMFGYFKPVLQEVDNIHGLELPLWSDKLKCAGTVDLIAEYRGKTRIIDWKNATRYKSKDEIPGYFMQMSAYAAMFYERTSIKINDLMVVISTKDYGLVVHEEKTSEWLSEFIKARKSHKS